MEGCRHLRVEVTGLTERSALRAHYHIWMQHFTAPDLAVLLVELVPAVVFGLAGERVARVSNRWPTALRVALPVVCGAPYLLVSLTHQVFSPQWLVVYTVLPVAVAWLLLRAAHADPQQNGNWRDAVILLVLGVAVDLRWLEPAWPAGLAGLGKLLLVDAALYGFVVIRGLQGTGFDFHFRRADWKAGLRELAFFAPIVIVLALALGFLQPHWSVPRPSMALAWVYIFVFIAVPEELFFRAWVQNLLERRLATRFAGAAARKASLLLTSVLFGLSHFNKRSPTFNWRYVILATIAGIFYGRAWRRDRRVPASAITHASVDWIWSWWF